MLRIAVVILAIAWFAAGFAFGTHWDRIKQIDWQQIAKDIQHKVNER